eukprot:5736872-Amphidinium_carterae.1
MQGPLPMSGTDKHKQRWRLELRNSHSKNRFMVLRKVSRPPPQVQISVATAQCSHKEALRFMTDTFKE